MGAGCGTPCQAWGLGHPAGETNELRVHRELMTQGEVKSTGHRHRHDISGSLSVPGNTRMEAGRQRGMALRPETPAVITLHSSVTNITHTG